MATANDLRNRIASFRILLSAGAACLLLSACYTYSPVQLGSLRPPENVRAHLTEEGAARFSEVFGAPQPVLTGELVDADDRGLSLVVPSGSIETGIRSQTLTQTLVIPREEVVAVQRRRLDGTRTAALAAAAAAVTVYLIVKAFSGERGGTIVLPPGGGPGEDLAPWPPRPETPQVPG